MPLEDFIIDNEEEAPSGLERYAIPDKAPPAVAQAPPPILPPPESFGYSAYIRAPVTAPRAWAPYGQYVTDRGQIENRIAFDPSKGLALLSKLALTPEEAQAGMEAAVAPFLPEKDRRALMESPLAPGPLAKATAGFTQGAAGTAESLTSPMNLGLMVGTGGLSKIPAAGRLLSGAFAVDMGRHVPELARNLGEAVASKDPEAITRAATELAATGAFTATAGTHAIGPRPAPNVVLPEAIRELSKEPSTTGAPNAIQERQAAETVRGVSEQPIEGGRPVPIEESAGGVPPRAVPPGDAQGAPRAAEARATEVPLTEAPSPLPEKFQGKPIAETADLVKGVTSEELAAYKGTAGAGPTGFMWDIGAKARTAEDVAALRKMGEEASAETKALMAKGDLAGAMKVIGRQPAEAYEYATGVKLDGTPKWEVLEKMAAMKGQTYKPPVPDAQYLKAKGGEPVETQIQKGKEVLGQGKAVAEPALGEATAAPTTILESKAEFLPTDLPSLAQLRITKPELRPQIDAKIAELQSAAAPAAAAMKQLPPVPAGHVRLFHGEGGPQGGGT